MNCTTAREYMQRELDGELSAVECEALHEHLGACEACGAAHRQLVTLQRAMHRLAAESDRGGEDLPPIAFGRPRRTVYGIRWRAWLAAAAVIALCVGGWFAWGTLRTNAVKSPQVAIGPVPESIQENKPRRPTPETRNPEPGIRDREPTPPLPARERDGVRVTALPDPRPPVRVTFAPSSDVIAVPVETRNPNVTIIWMYPTLKTAKAAGSGSPEPPQTMPTRSQL